MMVASLLAVHYGTSLLPATELPSSLPAPANVLALRLMCLEMSSHSSLFSAILPQSALRAFGSHLHILPQHGHSSADPRRFSPSTDVVKALDEVPPFLILGQCRTVHVQLHTVHDCPFCGLLFHWVSLVDVGVSVCTAGRIDEMLLLDSA